MHGFAQAGFLGTRCNIYPWTDGSALPGWIVAIKDGSLILRVSVVREIVVGTEASAEAYGRKRLALFTGKIESVEPIDWDVQDIDESSEHGYYVVRGVPKVGPNPVHVELSIASKIEYVAYDSHCRVLAENMSAFIERPEGLVKAAVLDVSESGLGLASTLELKKGEKIQMQAATVATKIELHGEVMYCQPIPGNERNFRTGVQLTLTDSHAIARWAEIVRDMQSVFENRDARAG
ncbi:MAG: PilZ domain-containing protein [Armatimonadetes bacterium]|nr:PilZ domain-containing protein [Armatimonadota bacterium]